LHPEIEQDIINKQVDSTTKNYKVTNLNEKATNDNFVYFYVFIHLERCSFIIILLLLLLLLLLL